MKKMSFLFLIVLSVNVYSQDKTDSLLYLLDSVTDTARIRILKELCWKTKYSRPSDALEYELQALSLSRQFEVYDKEAEILNFLGVIQRNVGDHATALEYFFKAQRLAEEYNINRSLAYTFNNIGDK